MSVAEQLPLAQVKKRLSEVVDLVESEHARVTITEALTKEQALARIPR